MILLTDDVLCGKFPCTNFVNFKSFDVEFGASNPSEVGAFAPQKYRVNLKMVGYGSHVMIARTMKAIAEVGTAHVSLRLF